MNQQDIIRQILPLLLNREYPAAEVVEINGEIPNEPIIFAGVGAGLVGPLSIGHMIAEMDMKEIALHTTIDCLQAVLDTTLYLVH